MIALAQAFDLHRGHARLDVEMVFGESTVTSAVACNPMKLLTPVSRGRSVWAYASSFGGGLVAGDETRLDIQIGNDTRCFFSTQSSTKVYRNPSSLPCSHQTAATLRPGSLLIFAPDPVQAFADSSYSQAQEFHLATGAGLVLLDWFTSGRSANGERWAFAQFRTRNDVFIDGERVFIDSLLLDSRDGSIGSSHCTGRFNCFATLLLIGEPLQTFASRLLTDISARPVEKQSSLICSASPVRNGALLRIAGESVEAVSREIKAQLSFASELLGDDPWARKR